MESLQFPMLDKVAIVAAMEREVMPLVRCWKVRTLEHAGRKYRLFENGNAALICGGIGADAARRATEAAIQEMRPTRVISVGFAGALDPALKVADVVEPGIVINASDGARTEIGSGEYALVSYSGVAGKDQKRRLREAYGAALVDMESAAVARGAEARGVEFGALKVISDDAEFAMLDVSHFVTPYGGFQLGGFLLHLAVRPWLWGTTVTLARNSAKASRALSDAISDYLEREAVSTHASG